MSGPQNCFVCSSKFGLFKRQHECNKCHRTACKSCLSCTMVIPGEDKNPKPVCKECYNLESSKTKLSGRISPPANFKREMAKKQEIQKQEAMDVDDAVDEEITNRLRKLQESYIKKDISVDEIQDRLQKLCASEPSVTMEELEYRLAKLKGTRPPAIRVHSIRKRPNDNEAHSSSDTSDRQVKRLVRQYTEEIALEAGASSSLATEMSEYFHPEEIPKDPTSDDLIKLARRELTSAKELQEEEKMQDDEIRRRLSQITDAPSVPITGVIPELEDHVHFDDEGMDEQTSQLIKRLMEEDRLEQMLQENIPSPRGSSNVTNHGSNNSKFELM